MIRPHSTTLSIRFILNVLVFCAITGISSVFGQIPETLDNRRYNAWSVEYTPYRLLIENGVDAFRTLNQESIPPVEPEDTVVLIQWRGKSNELYQLWYGTSAKGYTVLTKEQLGWVLGETLETILVEKDKYYSMDSNVPFITKESQPELDYLDKKHHWTRSTGLISVEKSAYYFNSNSGVYYQWGHDLLSRPYNLLGMMKLGIATPAFKVGLLTHSLMNLTTGYVWYNSFQKRLLGAQGAYGSFNFDRYYGEIGFAKNTVSPLNGAAPGDPVNYIDFYAIGLLESGYKVSYLFDAVTVRFGTAVYRVNHQRVDTSGSGLNRSVMNGEMVEPTTMQGLLLRLDATTELIDGTYPRLEGIFQYLTGTGLLLRGRYNINQVFSVPLTVVYLTSGENWDASFGAFIGLQANLNIK